MKTFTILFIFSTLFLQNISFGVEINGTIYTLATDGDFIEIQANMQVPLNEQKNIVLDIVGDTLTSVKHFFLEEHGKTTLYIIYNDTWLDSESTQTVLIGTFLVGSNKVLYYGDIFSKPFFEEISQSPNEYGKYSGGFRFEANVLNMIQH